MNSSNRNDDYTMSYLFVDKETKKLLAKPKALCFKQGTD